MGDETKIAWTDRTWNPWQGCHKVSDACKECYMHRDKKRYGQDPNTVIRSKRPTFNRPLSKTWSTPGRVFTCSWSDFFIKEADDWRDEAWDIIRETKHLTYQILTKRPERIEGHLPKDWPLPNVWLGVTAESWKWLLERWAHLQKIEAKVRFLSCEPLLGSLTLPNDVPPDWVIVGCESGPRARHMNVDWVRSIRNQCLKGDIPFFYKQEKDVFGKLVETPALDGIRWVQFPEVSNG